MLVIWALVLIIFGHFLLTKTRFGNWIYAAGGEAQAARYVGVPVDKVKVLMFMFTAFCACVFATSQVMEFGSAAADRGLLKEFEAIICVVIPVVNRRVPACRAWFEKHRCPIFPFSALGIVVGSVAFMALPRLLLHTVYFELDEIGELLLSVAFLNFSLAHYRSSIGITNVSEGRSPAGRAISH